MLVGFTKSGGRLLIMLGLSRLNVDRLIAGEPIKMTPELHNLPQTLEIGIFFGETEEVMKQELEKSYKVRNFEDRRP